jgi:hypothetical protein
MLTLRSKIFVSIFYIQRMLAQCLHVDHCGPQCKSAEDFLHVSRNAMFIFSQLLSKFLRLDGWSIYLLDSNLKH